MNNQTAIVPGSLGAIAQRTGASLAESFMNAELVAIVDTSGSMNSRDARGGRQRYEVACDELATLQKAHTGKIAVISFSDRAQFCPAGIPMYMGNLTDLAGALRFAKVCDAATMRFVVVSDGEPNDAEAALSVARTYQGRIDTVFVGPEGGRGAAFLQRLAAAQGGRTATASCADMLAATIERLALSAGS